MADLIARMTRVTTTDRAYIKKIVEKVATLYKTHGKSFDKSQTEMDLMAVHCSGYTLRLEEMASDNTYAATIAHDIIDISIHLIRDTGLLCDGFVPRFAVNQ